MTQEEAIKSYLNKLGEIVDCFTKEASRLEEAGRNAGHERLMQHLSDMNRRVEAIEAKYSSSYTNGGSK